ncbi:lyase [Tatumella morbirosei]|uniref:Lyase n=1 Tax=Tatumella morbirosei TaxID=642227 RepID=A0A095U7D5_9GAMM|nr:VOC family protein [Tatumella morbirosei]KGD70478.1 lyase [Tatumella morbirosei]
MPGLKSINHIAIIASDYPKSRAFYCDVLGFTLLQETYRETRDSWKGDLALNGEYLIELFSFPSAPPRPSFPEAIGLRHLAFNVDNIEASVAELKQRGVECEPVRIDPITGKPFTFFSDPDGLPLEICQL